MSEKRMLIVSSDLVRKIDENRGDLSQEEFVDFLVSSPLEQKNGDQKSDEEQYVTKETLDEFERDIKDLLRSFLDFFITYGLELGRQSDNSDMETLTQKLQGLGASSESQGRRRGSKG